MLRRIAVVAYVAAIAAALGEPPVFGRTAADQPDNRVAVEPAKIVVDLDLPPKQRWGILREVGMQRSWNVRDDIRAYLGKFVPKWAMPVLLFIVGSMRSLFLQEYADEMVSISDALGLELSEVVLVNFIYQLEAIGYECSAANTTGPCPPKKHKVPGLCTSVVAADADGMMWHGRNMDWNLDDSLLPYVVQAEYTRGGKTLFHAVQIVGMVGVLHGLRVDGYSLSFNAREEEGLPGGNPLYNFLQQIAFRQAKTPSHVGRLVLQNSATYHEAVVELSSHKLANPVYYIIAGTGKSEGVVMSRARDSTEDMWFLYEDPVRDVKLINPQPGWFRLQTNYDHWLPAPRHDDRRTPGVKHMKELGQSGVNFAGMKKVVTTWPTHSIFTDVTSVMCPKTNRWSAWVFRKPAAQTILV